MRPGPTSAPAGAWECSRARRAAAALNQLTCVTLTFRFVGKTKKTNGSRLGWAEPHISVTIVKILIETGDECKRQLGLVRLTRTSEWCGFSGSCSPSADTVRACKAL